MRAPACGYVDDPLRGPAALSPGSPEGRGTWGNARLAHIPTGSTANNHYLILNVSGEFAAAHQICPMVLSRWGSLPLRLILPGKHYLM